MRLADRAGCISFCARYDFEKYVLEIFIPVENVRMYMRKETEREREVPRGFRKASV